MKQKQAKPEKQSQDIESLVPKTYRKQKEILLMEKHIYKQYKELVEKHGEFSNGAVPEPVLKWKAWVNMKDIYFSMKQSKDELMPLIRELLKDADILATNKGSFQNQSVEKWAYKEDIL